MDGYNGEYTPARWGGRVGEWVGLGRGGTEISIRRIRPPRVESWWGRAEDWVRRWPFAAVALALLAGLVLGLRTDR